MGGDEARLLEAWRCGDPSAGEALFRRLFGPLRRFFVNKVRERAHVEELLASTFEILVRRGEAFEGRSSFLTFALGIARNVLRAYYREHVRHDAVDDVETLPIVEMGAGPFSLVAHRQEQQLLLHALRRIPLEHQVVLELFFWEHARAPEIAALLEVPLDTVHRRLRQGRTRLRREIMLLANDPQLQHDTIHDLEDWARSVRESLHENARPRAGNGSEHRS